MLKFWENIFIIFIYDPKFTKIEQKYQSAIGKTLCIAFALHLRDKKLT